MVNYDVQVLCHHTMHTCTRNCVCLTCVYMYTSVATAVIFSGAPTPPARKFWDLFDALVREIGRPLSPNNPCTCAHTTGQRQECKSWCAH